ncbi:hypothetical protein HW130_23730 [Streptomyces sp. PKU-EA00015]|uniref:hypothetical protein n=1 Tax=Streptomyces sp. PKU-EA00015 TaxID=2748326 RepID=UPI00159FF6DA|nr:hypothetical protein [Streptomyces sp. PKU-EA00015]NWF29228.1 hypothetical protein [Streptomyces sp. PKU-EA00015]
MKKLCSTLQVTMGIAACFTIGLQGTANAAPAEYVPASNDVSIMAHPTSCSNGQNQNGWEAHCRNSNGGSYKATVTCRPRAGGDLVIRDATVWKSSGLSIVFCPPLTAVVYGGIITKSTR